MVLVAGKRFDFDEFGCICTVDWTDIALPSDDSVVNAIAERNVIPDQNVNAQKHIEMVTMDLTTINGAHEKR